MQQILRAGSAALLLTALCACASAGETAAGAAPAAYDAALAERLGADEYGMRSYVLAILKTGPQDAEITDKAERAALFAGHFSNMGRLAEEGKLVLAGPLGGEDGRRGLFILNTPDIETAKAWVASDPTVEAGVFTIDYSKYYGSAALMQVNEVHARIQKKGVTD
ncbi:YCII domain protein [Hyphomonas neptunium ATCC 15444]|uniref:YCII domain protein n=2 Tax=Hyphomonas TaxID=85 RepID=Q0C3X9_HYPNA|nr:MULTISPECIES: YciI family protein [Hyphomonas]ABI76392.1 YCII domain protein [Hyphomonas neptunium ATCC 15444]KCZ96223.1 YCII domain-containing protein [Hyphomonas hirschiana VP5]